jgi:hypothetical protein
MGRGTMAAAGSGGADGAVQQTAPWRAGRVRLRVALRCRGGRASQGRWVLDALLLLRASGATVKGGWRAGGQGRQDAGAHLADALASARRDWDAWRKGKARAPRCCVLPVCGGERGSASSGRRQANGAPVPRAVAASRAQPSRLCNQATHKHTQPCRRSPDVQGARNPFTSSKRRGQPRRRHGSRTDLMCAAWVLAPRHAASALMQRKQLLASCLVAVLVLLARWGGRRRGRRGAVNGASSHTPSARSGRLPLPSPAQQSL